MRLTSVFRSAVMLGASILYMAACSEDPAGPGSGSIQLTIVTIGEEQDADGYRVRLPNGGTVDLLPNGSISVSQLTAGKHRLRIDGLEPNCNLAEGTASEFTVIAGQSVNVEFTVVCVAYTGSIRIRTTSEGTLPDPDGYAVTVSLPF